MIIVFGGSYQGKLDFTLDKFKLNNNDVFVFTKDTKIDYTKKIMYGLEEYIFGAIDRNENPIEFFETNISKFSDKIIVCTDISCGIVPLNPVERLHRDNTGKVMQILCRNAEEVYRVFCGIGERIK